MPQESGRPEERIRIKGARHNNLKGFDLDLPVRRLIVVTGLSGSGKSSLAFDTLYAEGQRRYIETFSPYARQFFDRMDKPRVEAIEGIPPAIALEQRNSVRTTRSTVGTMTEVCDHLKVLWPTLARLHCRQCGRPVVKEAPRDVWEALRRDLPEGTDLLVTFDLPLSARLSLAEQLALVTRQGFQRLLVDGEVLRVEDAAPRLAALAPPRLTVVQDRLRLTGANRSRFAESGEQAYHFGHGRLAVRAAASTGSAGSAWGPPRLFSRHLHCAGCDLEYRDPSPALFSFNHPVGACPACKGFGRVISIDYQLALPDRSKTLAGGAVKPWQSGTSAECQADLVRAARRDGVPLDVPFRDLSPAHQRWVLEGDPDYGPDHEWPKAWYGVKGYFRWLESKAYKMHVRVLLSRYRAYRTCPDCEGRRLQPDALLWRLPGRNLTLADFYALPIRDALPVIEDLASRHPGPAHDPFALALAEVRARLGFLAEVGVGYLTLDRPTRTLSGGETQRVNLTTCLGSRLVNSLFVLDEPSVGLHARDTERLVRVLLRLRDLGNTVVVVEHEAAVMRAADHLIDLGPGHGDSGGDLVAQGRYEELLRHPVSLTGAYLAGRRRIDPPPRRPVPLPDTATQPASASEPGSLRDQAVPYAAATAPAIARRGRGRERAATQPPAPAVPPPAPAPVSPPLPCLQLRGLTRHNLRDLSVAIPLGRLVCLAGVSGSGKTTLAGELLRLLGQALGGTGSTGHLGAREGEREGGGSGDGDGAGDGDGEGGDAREAAEGISDARLEGADHLGAVLLVDQTPIGRTPRSNPAVYTGAFEPIRELFAQTDAARQRGLGSSAFSFNSAQGQCEQCRGAGFEKIEMQFLSDVFIRCPACEGRRYRPHILDIRLAPDGSPSGTDGRSIAEVLDLSIDEALVFFARLGGPAADRARERLRLLQEVGLGYLRLGQPINTLSGGESQRLKLAGHLAESAGATEPGSTAPRAAAEPRRRGKAGAAPPRTAASDPAPRKPTLFVFDEPTTGLHFEDVRILLQAFQRLVDAGHSVLIIEHNLDVLKSADWVIDLGPEGGDEGGRVVASGTPEAIAACPASHTGAALREALKSAAA